MKCEEKTRVSIETFAEEHDLTMVIENFNDNYFCAYFKNTVSNHEGGEFAIIGSGRTKEEAIAEFAIIVSDQTLEVKDGSNTETLIVPQLSIGRQDSKEYKAIETAIILACRAHRRCKDNQLPVDLTAMITNRFFELNLKGE